MLNLENKSDFFGYVYDIFCRHAQKNVESVNLTFSRKGEYALITMFPTMSIQIPLPRFRNGSFYFEGFVFEDSLDRRRTMWLFFLATIYHLASHAAVSKYSLYENWIKNKTVDVYSRVINFIEDFFVEQYILTSNPGIWKLLIKINGELEKFENTAFDENKSNKTIPPDACCVKDIQLLSKIRSSLEQINDDSDRETKILAISDLLYKNRHLLPKVVVPYLDRDNDTHIPPRKIMLEIDIDDEITEIIDNLDNLWTETEHSRIRLLKQYEKYLKGLQFDSISISQESFQEFVLTREKILPMVRRIKQQIRTIVNVTESPKIDEVGLVDMQMAIQSISSKGRLTEVFERVEENRVEEAWVILVDKSASMRLHFDQIKEFTICVAEAANELTGRSDSWAMYSFDNNFQIIKDFKERYGRQVQARLGGLQNNGLSLLPDAIELSFKILADDHREKKFLFVITDGHPSGYERIQEQFSKISKRVEKSGILLVAIGVSKTTSKKFKNSARGNDLKQLVAKFITAYRTASSDM